MIFFELKILCHYFIIKLPREYETNWTNFLFKVKVKKCNIIFI